MRKISHCLLGFIAATSVTGCAQLIAPDSLARPTRDRTLVVLPGFKTDYTNTSKVRFEMTITAAPYQAAYEDTDGTFYQGPPQCHSEKIVDIGKSLRESLLNRVALRDCGVYLPHDPVKPALIYTIAGSTKITDAAPPAIDSDTANSIGMANAVGTTIGAYPTLPISQAAAGGALGVVLVAALIEAERGMINRHAPTATLLRPYLAIPNAAPLSMPLVKEPAVQP